ncbi:MAG: DUF799 family lipoprotein [Elusimicrobia bacterium]|nr:DUF799 family lipoprotein [Elusimicrobiota bacterium]
MLFAVGATTGCASTAPRQPLPYGGSTIALLLLTNNSNSVKAPEIVRRYLAAEFRRRMYRVQDEKETDAALDRLGIRDGGEIRTVPFKKLSRAVRADVLCFGTVLEYAFKSALLLSVSRVRLSLHCDTSDGKPVFDGDEFGVTGGAGPDAVGKAAINIAGKVVKSVKDSSKKLLPGSAARRAADFTDEISDVDLRDESREAARKLVDKFPQ